MDYKEIGKIFLDNLNNIIKTEYCNKQEIKYKQILLKMKKYFRENAKSGAYKKIQNDCDEKEKEINKNTNTEIEKLKSQKEYEKFQENSCVNKKINSLLEFGKNLKDVFTSMIFFNEKKKRNNSEFMIEIINNHDYKKYIDELEAIEKKSKQDIYEILKSEVYNMCCITQNDKKIFEDLEKIKEENKEKINNYISQFKGKENHPTLLIEDNKKEIDEDLEEQYFQTNQKEEENITEIITLSDNLIYNEYEAL